MSTEASDKGYLWIRKCFDPSTGQQKVSISLSMSDPNGHDSISGQYTPEAAREVAKLLAVWADDADEYNAMLEQQKES